MTQYSIALAIAIGAVTLGGCSKVTAAKIDWDASVWRQECFGDYTVECVNRLVKINLRIAELGKELAIKKREEFGDRIRDEQMEAGMKAVDTVIIGNLKDQRPGFFPRWFMGGREYWGKRTAFTTQLLTQEDFFMVMGAGVEDYNVKHGLTSRLRRDLGRTVTFEDIVDALHDPRYDHDEPSPTVQQPQQAAQVTKSSPEPTVEAEPEPIGKDPEVIEQQIKESDAYMQSAGNAMAEAAATAAKAAQMPIDVSIPNQPMVSASFDCAKAGSRVEHIICGDSALAQQDVHLASLYRSARANAADADVLKREQNAWRREVRDACSNAVCVARAYNARIAQLTW